MIPLTKGPDLFRWEATRQARRILYGDWKEDLRKRVREQVGSKREQAWGTVDISANLLRSIAENLAVLYDREPIVSGPELVVAEVARSGIWSLMKRIQRDTLALREMLVRVDATPDGLTCRPVYPDMVVCRSTSENPSQPHYLEELRQWEVNGKPTWVWEVFDLSVPSYRVEIRTDGDVVDITSDLHSSNYEHEAYPYRYSDGTPFIPYVLYHASNTGFLWDHKHNTELVEGTLNIGVYYSYLGHCIRSASWPQRYAVGVQLSGASVTETGSQATVDPTTVALFESLNETQQPQIGQWQAGSDPASLVETISQYERRLLSMAGVNPADLQRASGDPKSGYALAITREAQRAAQRQYEGQFRIGDLEFLRKSAALLSRALEVDLPEGPFSIQYQSIPQSAEEEQAQREWVQFLLASGLITRERAFNELFPAEQFNDPQQGANTNA